MDYRKMTDEELKKALQDIIDKLESDDEPEDPSETDEQARAIMEEMDRRDKERAKKIEREKRRTEMRNAAVKFGAIVKERKAENFGVDYRSAWLRNLQGKPLNAEERAAITDAKNIIPTETMNEIIGKLADYPLLNAIDITHIPGNVTFPVADTVNDADWVEMAKAATDKADKITAVALGAYKLIKTVSITADMQAMAIDAFEAWIVDSLSERLAKAIDYAVINGSGTNQATGIVTALTAKNYAKSGLTFKGLMGIIAAVPAQYRNNATFVMNSAEFYGEVLGLETPAGDKVVVQDAQAPEKMNILGYPVICNENVPDSGIIFGYLKGYKFNFSKDIEVTFDDSAEFRTGNRVYRGMALADGKLADPAGVVYYTKASA